MKLTWLRIYRRGYFGSTGFVKKDWPIEAKKPTWIMVYKNFLKGQYHEEIIEIYN